MENQSTKPKNRIKRIAVLFCKTVAAICILIVGAAIISVSVNGSKKSSDSANYEAPPVAINANNSAPIPQTPMPPKPVTPQIPADQAAFYQIIQHARNEFSSAPNDMLKGRARASRKQAICKLLPSRKAINWLGTIEKLSSNNDGKGVLAIQLDHDITVQTHNNDLSDDISGRTMLAPNSALFNKVAAMKEGNAVIFSGTFISGADDCFSEMSLSQRSSIDSPEFIIRFSDVALAQ
ncbi:MAG: hypothetical protein ACKVOE_04480 [Rickettsiales bacterium]